MVAQNFQCLALTGSHSFTKKSRLYLLMCPQNGINQKAATTVHKQCLQLLIAALCFIQCSGHINKCGQNVCNISCLYYTTEEEKLLKICCPYNKWQPYRLSNIIKAPDSYVDTCTISCNMNCMYKIKTMSQSRLYIVISFLTGTVTSMPYYCMLANNLVLKWTLHG